MLFHFKCLYSVSLRTQPQCLSTVCVNKFQILHPPCLGHELETHTWAMSGTHQGIPNQGSLRSAGWTGGAGIISIRAHSGAPAESGSRPPGPENFRPGKAPGARLDCCLQKWGVAQTPQIYRLEQKPATNLEKRGLCSELPLKLFVLALRAARNLSL